MRKLRCLLFGMLLFPVVESLGQTKDETIAWINEKLLNNTLLHSPRYSVKGGHNKFSLQSVDECTIVYRYERYFEDGRPSVVHEEQLPIAKIKIDSYISSNGKVFLLASSTNEEVIRGRNLTEGTSYLKKSSSIEVPNTDNLRERLTKALNHLATFCQNKKETF
ncbi:hypothetical protein [Pedobacter chitinilyticus]|uniref:Uncharacterized protein n=1 Tax=Pedobacter chitinilyticus TaxID=2233776 RepID=A0A451GDE5_9SPHI|nr:hypothetical protein [Pedobacter chitinilyticus]RWU10889.1 hypothetical protein DPV69_06040 [Pedobacter chitinilyticus]